MPKESIVFSMEIKLTPVIDFGKMPIANAFLTPDEFATEYFYQMVVGFDPATKAIGLVNRVPPEKMFHGQYAFFSSTSKSMQAHFRATAEKLLPYAGSGLVVEMGSNDGIMLEAWKELGVQAVGVEPSANVAAASRGRGHRVIERFMDDRAADEILGNGSVSLVYGANVSCHIEDFVNYARLIARLIGKSGVFVFEDPYFLDIVDKTSYDQIYDEHVWYFTISFINNIFSQFGYHVFDCEHIDVHGGELRMYVGHKDTHTVTPSVSEWLAKEADLPAKLELLKANIIHSKSAMQKLLRGLKVDLHSKIAFPFITFIVMLIGAPLAMRTGRASAMVGVGTSLFVVVLYYTVHSVCMAMGKGGHLPPPLAAWFGNIIFAAVGIYLIKNSA